jgi:peptidyl-prolyl cis-trans isomerase D
MLDLMRRKKRLKVVLWLVIVSLGMGMLLLFVPGSNVERTEIDTTAASVNGESISMQEFMDAYRRAVKNYSANGQNKTDPETLKSLGLDKQALEALINVKVIEYAADQLGLGVSPEEVRRAVETHPNLQDQGGFVGVDRYKALLAANGISIQQFEDGMRYSLLAQKVRNLLVDSITLTEKELKDEFLRNNQDAVIAFVIFDSETYKKRITPKEQDLRAYFEAHKEKYRIKEQRRAQYLLIPVSTLAQTIPVTEEEIKEAWANQASPEMVDAAHILFEVKDPSEDGEVKARAEAILKRAKAGEDFAELARKYSEDSGSASSGGDLGPFPRGRMVKEFEDAAFALKPGEISDLVRTEYGYHIIKVYSHEVPKLEQYRPSIVRGIQINKATEIARKKAAEAQRLAETQKDLNALAKALDGVPTEIKETEFLSKDSEMLAGSVSKALLDEIFNLKEINAVGKAVETPMGFAIPKLLETRLPKPPDFTESRAAIEKDYIDAQAAEMVQKEAKNLSEEAAKDKDLEVAARKYKFAVKTSAPFKRDGSPDPALGYAPQVTAAAFSLPEGGISQPISLPGTAARDVVLQVLSRTPFDADAFEKQKSDIRSRMLASMEDAYFEEYVQKITQDLERRGKIRKNPHALEQVAQYSFRY